MKHGRLLWRIYLSFLLAAGAALILTTWYNARCMRRFHEEQVSGDLTVRAQFFASDLSHYELERDADAVDAVCKQLGGLTGTRITVILPDGTVVGDSDEDPARMDSHANRPEIREAFRGERGESTRFSDTLKRKLKYVATPLMRDERVIAAVRTSRPLAEIRWTRRIMSRQIVLACMSSVLLFAAVALYLSRRITRPLESMRRAAVRMAAGDLASRMPVSTPDEIGALAEALNEMASQLRDRMDTIVRQQAEQDAVLSCMAEGVIAADKDGRILYLNDAATRLLGIPAKQARGRSVEATVRHRDLQEFIRATLATPVPSEAETVIRGGEEHHVQLHGTPLTDTAGQHIGGLVVMNDITRLNRLETVRSDFVANVSHELKTPITALRGCVETLSGDDELDAGDRSRFMDMMSRQAGRMESIVQDLLSLSRIEAEVDNGAISLEQVRLIDVIRRVTRSFEQAAKQRGISLSEDCPQQLSVPACMALLEQAIGNLVDNAIKYGGENTAVSITAEREGDEVVIRVADRGRGMAKQHLQRIFERFYRVDKARSRALGGTGLGLSIVKHILLAHRGRVSVESTLGQGTTCTLHLPCE